MGWLFQCVMFLTFVLPISGIGAIQVGSAVVEPREFGFILLPMIYMCYPRTKLGDKEWRLKGAVILLLVAIGLTAPLKTFIVRESVNGFLRDLRMILPLLSGLGIVLLGVRIRPMVTMLVLLYAILGSFLVSLVLYLLGIDSVDFMVDGQSAEVMLFNKGRFVSMNAPFCILAWGVLLSKRKMKLPLLLSVSIYVVCPMAIMAGILTFNRTIAVAQLLIIAINYRLLIGSRKVVLVISVIAFVAIGLAAVLKSDSDVLNQVEARILVAKDGLSELLDAGYYGTRDELYRGYVDVLKEYWLVGSPNKVKVTERSWVAGMEDTRATDISVVTMASLFGVFVAGCFCWFWWVLFSDFLRYSRLHRRRVQGYDFFLRATLQALPIYALVSLNYDVLARAPIVLVIILFSLMSRAIFKLSSRGPDDSRRVVWRGGQKGI